MLDFLDRLREKPEGYRARVAVLVAGVVTAVIALMWLFTLNFSGDTNATISKEPSSPSPFATLQDGLAGLFEEGVQQFEGIQNAFREPPMEGDQSE